MEGILQALKGTPLWVYLLFVFLIWLGVKSIKTRVLSIYRLAILPTFITFMGIQTARSAFSISFLPVFAFVLALILGGALGMREMGKKMLRVDQKRHLVEVPGTWMTLILILVIFSAKYYFGYALARDPTRAEDTTFELSLLSVTGLCVGLLVGRFVIYLYKLIKGPSYSL